MFGNLGFGEILLLVLIALLLFGPSKLPELGRALGRTLREFKSGARELMADDPVERRNVTPPSASQANAASSAPSQANAPSQAGAAPSAPEERPADTRRLPD